MRQLHAVMPGASGQGDVATVAETTDTDRLAALEVQVQEIATLRRRVTLLEAALGGIQGAVSVLKQIDEDEDEMSGAT